MPAGPEADSEPLSPGADEIPAGEVASAPTERAPFRPAPATDPKGPPRGSQIGRFTVLEPLGRGGMSVVLAAYDPKLDRRVALKLMHPGGHTVPGDTEEVRARLLREARAMARLRHPNVLTVHDAGEHQGQVYVAMEEFSGGTLRDHLRRRREEPAGELHWREVIALFLEAGRGLAAAHQAGLVHRDFKPDNVLLERDAAGHRVVVADFGLVGLEEGFAEQGGAAEAEGTADAEAAGEPATGDRLTSADMIMGTPMYMPPEQHRGLSLDARADQFAFCVSMYEALYGELPFAGRDRTSYVRAAERGEVRPPPAGNRVPSWVREVLLRGLSANPDDRYPTLEALLAEFAEDNSHASRWRLAAGATVGLGFVFLGVISLGAEITFTGLQRVNLICLALVVIIYLVARNGLLRSRLNRRLYAVLLLGVVLVSLTHAGAKMAGFEPAQSLLLISLLSAAMTSVLTVLVAWVLAPMALGYLGAFFVGAAWPAIALLALTVAHGIAFANATMVLRRERPRLNRLPGARGR